MRKSVVMLIVFAMLSSILITLFAGALALADGVAVTKNYQTNGQQGLSVLDKDGALWDLTRGDLKVSYTLNMSKFTVQDNKNWTKVGVVGPNFPNTAPEGYMASGSPGSSPGSNIVQSDTYFDKVDMLVLGSDWPGDNGEGTYNATDPNTIVPGYPVTPWNPWNNSGIWFDRGGVDPSQQSAVWGLQDGKNFNTKGIYNVEITFHSVDPVNMTNTMFATVNGVPTYFYAYMDGQFKWVPAGKSFYGDPKQMEVFLDLEGAGVQASGISATGAPAAPTVRYVDPNTAEQGTTINGMGVYGYQFRDTASMVQLTKTSQKPIQASKVTFLNTQVLSADITIPDNAAVGMWDTNFWHLDDPAGIGTVANSFTVTAAAPVVNSISPNHMRPNTTFTMTITGKHFRNVAMKAMLWRGGDIYLGKNIKYVSPTQVKADFTLPANAYIGVDWSVTLTNLDDNKYSDLYNVFSVDAHVDIYSNSWFNTIWLHAPWIDTAVIYSEGDFDATTLFPLGCAFGGTFPIACQPLDWNHDGKKDLVLYFSNMSVNLPVGTNSVSFDGATLGLRRVRGWDTVRVFKFLF